MKNRCLFFLICLCLVSASLHAVTLQEAKNLIAEKDYPRAVTALRTLIQQPNMARNAECNKFLGQALCMTGQYQEAVPYLIFGANNGKNGAWWYLGICRQHLYDFPGAIEALEKYRSCCSESSGWIPRTDSIIAECKVGLKGVNHVQDVVIIDSMMVPRQAFFSHYRLGAESGRILTSSSGNPVFENQSADCRVFASQVDGKWRLSEQHRFADEWEPPTVIASIDAGSTQLCFPFVRTDSETLFFACDSTPGFGGFDIYKTHYNREIEAYYTPERLGMPFNSPFNDYMMAIDETHQVGWWATDRNAAADMVCIYLFQLQDDPTFLDGENPDRARIASIRDSWTNPEGYAELVRQIYEAPQQLVVQQKVRIPISDQVVYTSADQFRVKEARTAYESSLAVNDQLLGLQASLDKLREQYHRASKSQRAELVSQILEAEQRELLLISQLSNLRKQYRILELSN